MISIDLGAATNVEIDFTEIRDIETGETRPDITLHDLIPISISNGVIAGWFGGEFESAQAYTVGNLMGPDASEVAEVFALQSIENLVGSYGARRDPDEALVP